MTQNSGVKVVVTSWPLRLTVVVISGQSVLVNSSEFSWPYKIAACSICSILVSTISLKEFSLTLITLVKPIVITIVNITITASNSTNVNPFFFI